MIKNLFLLLAAISISVAWLAPSDDTLWQTFIGEFLAFYGVFFLILSNLGKEIKVPNISIPILLIALLPLLQYMQGIVFFSTTALLSSAYILGFWVVLVVSYSIGRQEYERKKLMQGFCFVLLITGSISSIFAIFQWLNIYTPLPIMMPLQGNRPYANFGQPNHLATFLLMSLLGSLYLFEKKKLNAIVLSLMSLLGIFVIALTQSRTSWIAIILVIGIWIYKSNSKNFRLNKKYVTTILSIYLLFVISIPSINILFKEYFGMNDVVQTSDVIQRVTTGHERLSLWSTAIDSIMLKPWLGHGWNQTGNAHLQVIENFPYWFTSAHNIVLDLIIWNGLIIGLIIVIYALYWLWLLWRACNDYESIIAIMMIGTVLTHTLFEYPLNYSYFLFPVGFLIGIVSSGTIQKSITSSKHFGILVAALLIIGMTSIWNEYVNSFTLMANARSIESSRLEVEKPVYDEQTYLSHNNKKYFILSMIEARAEWIAVNPFTHLTKGEIEKHGNIVSSSPSPYDLYKYAQLLSYNGELELAKYYLSLLEIMHGTKYSIESIQKANKYGENI